MKLNKEGTLNLIKVWIGLDIVSEDGNLADDLVGHEMDIVFDLILDSIGVPKDNSLEVEDVYDPCYYSRDHWFDVMHDYKADNDIDQEAQHLLNKLINFLLEEQKIKEEK